MPLEMTVVLATVMQAVLKEVMVLSLAAAVVLRVRDLMLAAMTTAKRPPYPQRCLPSVRRCCKQLRATHQPGKISLLLLHQSHKTRVLRYSGMTLSLPVAAFLACIRKQGRHNHIYPRKYLAFVRGKAHCSNASLRQ